MHRIKAFQHISRQRNRRTSTVRLVVSRECRRRADFTARDVSRRHPSRRERSCELWRRGGWRVRISHLPTMWDSEVYAVSSTRESLLCPTFHCLTYSTMRNIGIMTGHCLKSFPASLGDIEIFCKKTDFKDNDMALLCAPGTHDLPDVTVWKSQRERVIPEIAGKGRSTAQGEVAFSRNIEWRSPQSIGLSKSHLRNLRQITVLVCTFIQSMYFVSNSPVHLTAPVIASVLNSSAQRRVPSAE